MHFFAILIGVQVEKLGFDRFVNWCFLAFITGGLSWCVHFASTISSSITELNVNIATLLERTSGQAEELKDHAHRLNRLETRFK